MLVRIWSKRNSNLLLEGKKNSTTTLEDRFAVSYISKHNLTMQSSNCAFWCYSNESKTHVHTKTCARMSIAALFIIVKTWKQYWCIGWIGRWINCGTYSGTLLISKKKWAAKLWKDPVPPVPGAFCLPHLLSSAQKLLLKDWRVTFLKRINITYSFCSAV